LRHRGAASTWRQEIAAIFVERRNQLALGAEAALLNKAACSRTAAVSVVGISVLASALSRREVHCPTNTVAETGAALARRHGFANRKDKYVLPPTRGQGHNTAMSETTEYRRQKVLLVKFF